MAPAFGAFPEIREDLQKREPKAARYVDGFVIRIPKKNVERYRRMAEKAAKVWRGYGALEFRECVGDDLNVKGVVPFSAGGPLIPGVVSIPPSLVRRVCRNP